VSESTAQDNHVHREEVTAGVPPLALKRSWFHRVVAFALPSETVSFASALAGAVMFWQLSAGEGPRYFFRMPQPWGPLAFSLSSLVLCLVIAFIGSRRPGPLWPRLWVAALAATNAAVAGLVVYTAFARSLPSWLATPYPLHALSLSAAVSAAVLMPRFLRLHPLQYSVQLIAPVSLALFVTLAWNGAVIYMNQKIAAERQTILTLAAWFDDAALQLREAASEDFTSSDGAGSGVNDDEEIEKALAGLEPPRTFPEIDTQRWEAVGVLERTGHLKSGELIRAIRVFALALVDTVSTDRVPAVRLPRFRMRQSSSSPEYVDAANLVFERAAGIGLRYYDAVGRWLPALSKIEVGPPASDVAARRKEINDHIAVLLREPHSWWWGLLLDASRDKSNTSASMSALLRQPFLDTLRPAADGPSGLGPTWRRTALRVPSPCERVDRMQIENRTKIPAPDETLTEEQLQQQRDGLATYYIGERYDVQATARCFAYHPPIRTATDADDLIVFEVRLRYRVANRESRGKTPCAESQCWPSLGGVPPGTKPASVTVLVDLPEGAPARYQDEVASALHSVFDTHGITLTQAMEQQPDGRQALKFVLTGVPR
jgi:hypothetical protein